ncbi:MAG TPA: ABC transporter permease [Gemmatimonadaceae bacterium]|nr:ABC transporter permease [Gemmatimonadaceae bacterium]
MKRSFRASVGERGVRRDVASEIQFHIDMRTRELVDAGVDPAAARQQAIATFGDVRAIEAECRSETRQRVRIASWREFVDSVAHDVRYGARTLARSPGFTVTVLLTLALGIGANSAVFSLVNGLLLERPPYANASRVVVVQRPVASAGIPDAGFAAPEVGDFRAQTPSVDAVAEYHSMSFDLLGHGDPRRVQTGVVSADFFDLLGVQPLLGRTFARGEDQTGAAPVLVLSYAFWVNQLGADSSIIGKTFTMNDRQHTVIGVLPPLPNYPGRNDVWMPVSSCPFRSSPTVANSRSIRMVTLFARTKPGTALVDVRHDLSTVDARLHAQYPDAFKGIADEKIAASPITSAITQGAAPAVLLLFGIAGLVLLIACANVAHLTLARHLRRQRELAIRAALGAGRRRVLRQLLTESVLLSLAGGALGLALAGPAVGAIAHVVARLTPRGNEVALDWRVVAFTLILSLLTGLAFGALPALADGRDLVTRLRDGGATTMGGRRLRARSALVVGEVALASVVLVGAGLMLRSFAHLLRVDAGYDPQNVVTAHVDLNWTKYNNGQLVRNFADALTSRLRATPGVTAVAVANEFPASSASPQNQLTFTIRGRPAPDSAHLPHAELNFVSPEYFRAIGVAVLAGRDFTAADRDTANIVAVISRSLAEKYFPGENPVGRQLDAGIPATPVTIVGVAGDVRQFGPAADIPLQVYAPFNVQSVRDIRVLVRSRGDAAAMTRRIEAAVHEIDADQPVIDIKTLAQARSEVMTAPRLITLLLSLFGAVALTIAAAGLGGVMAYSVGQRMQEFGIRVALGAERSSILRLVVGQGIRLVVLGLLIGGLAAREVHHLMEKVLVGGDGTALFTYAGVAVLFLLVAIAACLVPARRATAVDPVTAFKTS